MLSGHMWGMTQKDPGYPDGMFCTLFLGVWGGGGGGGQLYTILFVINDLV